MGYKTAVFLGTLAGLELVNLVRGATPSSDMITKVSYATSVITIGPLSVTTLIATLEGFKESIVRELRPA
jgi:hypothetical protein